ncbi:hypothetical protein [Robiginitalea sp. SC105]|uniref:hypothetical protein n=1 Tax=Robiginitalea sp. SC105 TaxID=2762332 RepID=UPI00163959CE|nr:hypothetical protein [Robiginitalea sp. SC105]MBC2838607.1 hypothetical protein [Robiginitalea sp. SC105]
MIKFFRRIRQNLLSEGKTGKYLKYAIGEIFLVIIGILLALQIDNWNSERIAKGTFESNLQFAMEDLEQDKSDLTRLIQERKRVLDKADFILQAVDERKNLSAREIFENSEIMLWKSFEMNSNGFERLLASPIYESPQFQSIREKIKNYQANYQRIKGLEKKLNESIEEMEIEMSKDGSILELYEYSDLVFSLSYAGKEIDAATDQEILDFSMDFEKSFIENPPMLSLFQRGKLITRSIIQQYGYHIALGEDLRKGIGDFMNAQ